MLASVFSLKADYQVNGMILIWLQNTEHWKEIEQKTYCYTQEVGLAFIFALNLSIYQPHFVV